MFSVSNRACRVMLITTAASLSCQTRQDGGIREKSSLSQSFGVSSATFVDRNQVPEARCSDGESLFAERFQPQPPSPELQVDITYCLGETPDGSELAYVGRLILGHSQQAQVAVIPKAAIEARGVIPRFFTGDPTSFSVTAKIDDQQLVNLVAEGTIDDFHFVTTYERGEGPGSPSLPFAPGQNWPGYLVEGSYFDNRIRCEMADPIDVTRQFATVEITFTYCLGLSTSGGFGGIIKRINVIDSHPEITTQPATVMIPEVEFEEKFPGVEHHHNICDSMKIRTPWADYLMTAGPAGEGPPEEYRESCNSPDNFLPNPRPADGEWNTVYRIDYRDEIPTVSGTADFMHPYKNYR